MTTHPPLVLSLFPGADLLGRAFESCGASVVRGPDLLMGQDIREWRLPPPGRFDGIIGGPPCQPFSRAKNIGGAPGRRADMIPMFWDVVAILSPRWAVMENLVETRHHPSIPSDVVHRVISDWDCGGLTMRRRVFYIWPFELGCSVITPPRRPGRGEYSVLASSHKSGMKRNARGMLANINPEEAGRLQGWPEIADTLIRESDGNRIMPHRFLVHLLGNGVPMAMGVWIAQAVMKEAGYA